MSIDAAARIVLARASGPMREHPGAEACDAASSEGSCDTEWLSLQ